MRCSISFHEVQPAVPLCSSLLSLCMMLYHWSSCCILCFSLIWDELSSVVLLELIKGSNWWLCCIFRNSPLRWPKLFTVHLHTVAFGCPLLFLVYPKMFPSLGFPWTTNNTSKQEAARTVIVETIRSTYLLLHLYVVSPFPWRVPSFTLIRFARGKSLAPLPTQNLVSAPGCARLYLEVLPARALEEAGDDVEASPPATTLALHPLHSQD